ncbi:sugar ABC transporter substrate-binding protein [Paenibacillus baekrokdamisoli]|uniref:Sugar ABC transporter substrate-binding protein n=1 Tax=Paenibacillus baekrokdamisoli TaxID=1712516 RepID=A0A3G9IV70_9BACL|nr:extracellular solute-binding protein [Paenibacillus baekrokdamisoli]MBB3072602.1 ABC-type glycerol-3-phosphate transport system substrate-binding protein [Paenibacillus baekrokdamisoli]BBH22346.1 sugar ABC transporter substrate-binding protein [Paenibacillus baekrokdamisoli]
MNLRKSGVLLLLGASIILLSACGKSGKNDTASTDKDIKLVFWNTSYPTIDENDKTKKKEDFYIYKAIQRYEAANPGIKIDIQNIPDGVNAMTKFQTAGIAKNGPDLTNLWSGNYTLDLKSYIQPLNDYLKPEDIDQLTGWKAVTENFAEKGTIYGVPDGTDGTIAILYNKKLFADAGVDPVNNRPHNVKEFMDMLQKIKDKNVTPMGLGEDGEFDYFVDYWFAQMIGPAGINDIVNGKMDFHNPKLLDVVNQYIELNRKGFVTTDGAQSQFYNSKVALIFSGFKGIKDARAALGDNLGMIKIPDFSESALIHDGGVGGSGGDFVVSKYAKHPAETVKFILFLLSKEEQAARFEEGYNMINIKGIDAKSLSKDPLIVQQQEWANEPSTIFWPDNIYPSELSSYINSLNSLVVKDQLSADDFLSKLDQKRNEILAQK